MAWCNYRNALTSHPDVNMISFTGSTRAGALISKNAAKDFKRVSLELGGKVQILCLKTQIMKLLKEELLDVLEIQDNLAMLYKNVVEKSYRCYRKIKKICRQI